ncbi:MAG: glycosyltransferase [Arcanobacterium sp.]|nr:glycosyltransferase [Arcanobacterium sp.]
MGGLAERHAVMRDAVTAIVLAQNEPIEYLASTLEALAGQTYKPQQVLVVSARVTDDLHTLVSRLKWTSGIDFQLFTDIELQAIGIAAAAGTGFPQLVNALLRDFTATVESSISAESSGFQGSELPRWFWLLHADSSPQLTALDNLLKVGESSEQIACLGPKQVAWDANEDGSYDLVSMGINATRSARRVPEFYPGERDQGQYDNREDVLGLGTAGMLIRPDVLKEVGGFDENFRNFGEGLELSRRIRSAGYRVVIVPEAIIHHAQLGLGQGESLAKSFAARRIAQIRNSLIAIPAPLILVAWIGYILISPFRAVMRLILRDPLRAKAELLAGVETTKMLSGVLQRRKSQRINTPAEAALRQLESNSGKIRQAKRENRKAAKEAARLADLPGPLEAQAQADLQRVTRRGALAVAILAVLYTLVMFLPVFTNGVLVGGNLAADQANFFDIWRATWNSWFASGSGSSGVIDPLWVLALPILAIGAVFGLNLGQIVTIGVYLSPLIAALGTYFLIGRITKSWQVRVTLSLLWLAAPHFLTGLQLGYFAPVLLHAVLPWFVWALIGAFRNRAGQLGLAAILLAIISALSPLWLLLGLLLSLVLSFSQKRHIAWIWLAVPALTTYAPNLREAWKTFGTNVQLWQSYLFAQPGAELVTQSTQIRPRDLIWGFTNFADAWSGAQLIFTCACGGIVLVALFALLRNNYSGLVRGAWLLALFGAALGVAALYTSGNWYWTGESYLAQQSWPGIGLTIFWLGIVLVLAAGSANLRTTLRKRSLGIAHLVGFISLLLVPISVLALFTTWQYQRYLVSEAQLSSALTQPIPAIAETNMNSAKKSRVLWINPEERGVQAQIWRSAGLALHESRMLENIIRPDAINPAFAATVAELLAGSTNSAQTLSEQAISVVLVPPVKQGAETEFRAELISTLHSTPGFEYVTENDSGIFWRVLPNSVDQTARASFITSSNAVQILESDTYKVETKINIPEESILRLAESHNSGWQATVNGESLKRVPLPQNISPTSPDLLQNQWILPATENAEINIWYQDSWHQILRSLQFLIGAIAILVALPIRPRKDGRE